MLRRFGSLLWRQSRDISVYNYQNSMVYEIFTNQGYLYLIQDKEKKSLEATDTLIPEKVLESSKKKNNE